MLRNRRRLWNVRAIPRLGDAVRAQPDDALARRSGCRRSRRVDAGDHVEQRGLAGAVRADHADDLVLVDVEVELVQRAQAAERRGRPGSSSSSGAIRRSRRGVCRAAPRPRGHHRRSGSRRASRPRVVPGLDDQQRLPAACRHVDGRDDGDQAPDARAAARPRSARRSSTTKSDLAVEDRGVAGRARSRSGASPSRSSRALPGDAADRRMGDRADDRVRGARRSPTIAASTAASARHGRTRATIAIRMSP